MFFLFFFSVVSLQVCLSAQLTIAFFFFCFVRMWIDEDDEGTRGTRIYEPPGKEERLAWEGERKMPAEEAGGEERRRQGAEEEGWNIRKH